MPMSRTILMSPLWAAQLATGAKSFRDNPLIGSRWLNERGLHVARVRLAHGLAARRRATLARSVAPADRATLDRDGVLVVPDFLPAGEFADLRDTLRRELAPARQMVQGSATTRRAALDGTPLRYQPAVRRLFANERWRGLMRYAGSFAAEPMHYLQTIFANADDGHDPQTDLHADTFHPTVKAWLFLEDVSLEDGPFSYVRGSARLTPERFAWERERSLAGSQADTLSARGSPRVSPVELAAMKLPDAIAFPVAANTLIVADTFGFHARAPAARASRRLEIFSYGRRNPFLPYVGGDLAAIPSWRHYRVPALWRAGDLGRRWFHQHWRDVGRLPGDAPLAD